MNMKALRKVWGRIEDPKQNGCSGCPLRGKSKPLLFKPERPVNVMVITEGPNRMEDKESIASLANHPTFTYLTALAGGKFVPEGEDATAYWIHVRKCFIRDENGEPLYEEVKEALTKHLDKKALEKLTDSLDKLALMTCSKSRYLVDEIKAVKPKLIVAVGKGAKNFLAGFSQELQGKLKDVFVKQVEGSFDVEIDGTATKVLVVPHPSGRSLFWTKLPPKTKEVLEMVRKEFKV